MTNLQMLQIQPLIRRCGVCWIEWHNFQPDRQFTVTTGKYCNKSLKPALRSALRPFIFSVHPDLFHLYPHQKSVNEDSLKALNEYVEHAFEEDNEKYASRRNRLAGQSLKFYQKVSQTSSANLSNTIPDQLHKLEVVLSENVFSSVKNLLEQGKLPIAQIDTLVEQYAASMKKSEISRNQVEWINMHYYAATGRENPFTSIWDEVNTLRPAVTLHQWLNKNMDHARKLENETRQTRSDYLQLSNNISREHKLSSISWECGWKGPHQLASLRKLDKLLQSDSQAKLIVQEKRIVFSNGSGISSSGDIILANDEVPEQWSQFLPKVPAMYQTVSLIEPTELHLSALLGGAEIMRKDSPPQMMAIPYYYSLASLVGKLGMATETFEAKSLVNLKVQVAGSGDEEVTLTQEGYICVPSESPVWVIKNFIRDHKSEADGVHACWKRLKSKGEDLLDQVRAEYDMKSLTFDVSMTWNQVITCCQSLLNNSDSAGYAFHGMRVCIAPYFSVMDDGEVYITWDWAKND